jgi:hypothetical protein
MKTAKIYLSVLFLGSCALACSGLKSAGQEKPSPVGDYQYVSYDDKGAKVVEGMISITSVEKRRIGKEEQPQLKGNWQLRKVGKQETIGGQVGSGELDGSILKGEIYLDLNPNMSDANVVLRGRIEGNRFHGTWSFNGYAGSLSHGTFEATRK